MPLTLNSAFVTDKNQLATTNRTLICLEIEIPGVADHVKIVQDNEDLIWNGATWTGGIDFDITDVQESSTGEVPRIEVSIANVNRVMGAYIENYDAYIKANGYSPLVVHIFVVNTASIAADPNCDPEVEHIFEMKQPKDNAQRAVFVLGATNINARRFPQNRILKNHCRYKPFKGTLCGYAGTATVCDRTLKRCRALSNSNRYGGAPGVGKSGFTVN